MLALYISLLDTEEQISKFEHIYTKYRGDGSSFIPQKSRQIYPH